MYGIIQALSFLAVIVFHIFYGKNYGYSKMKSFLLSVFSLSMDMAIIILLTWVENGFTNFGAQNSVRAFAFGIPLLYVESKIFNVDFRKNCDFQAPSAVLMFGLGHLACLFPGCCNGFEYCEGSFAYNLAYTLTGTNMLPVQLFESIAALITFVVLCIIAHKNNYFLNGRLFPIMLVLYGTQRFLFEFLRDNQKVLIFSRFPSTIDGEFGISNLSLWALAMLIEGIIFLILWKPADKAKT